MPRKGSASPKSEAALVEKLLAEQAALREELQRLRQQMSDMEADRTLARAGQDLSRAVQMERARMAEFWRNAEKERKVTIILSQPLVLTVAGRMITLPAGKNSVPQSLVPIIESRLVDIEKAEQFIRALQLNNPDALLPAPEVERLLKGE